MPSFAYLPINKVRAFLPLNGKTSKLVGRLSLPQGFKNSPTIFGNHLAKELENWEKENPEGLFLQDVDDILLVTEANEVCGIDYQSSKFPRPRRLQSILGKSSNHETTSYLPGNFYIPGQ